MAQVSGLKERQGERAGRVEPATTPLILLIASPGPPWGGDPRGPCWPSAAWMRPLTLCDAQARRVSFRWMGPPLFLPRSPNTHRHQAAKLCAFGEGGGVACKLRPGPPLSVWRPRCTRRPHACPSGRHTARGREGAMRGSNERWSGELTVRIAGGAGAAGPLHATVLLLSAHIIH